MCEESESCRHWASARNSDRICEMAVTGLASLVMLAGCAQTPFDRSSAADLRIVAVRSNMGSARPGDTVVFDMLYDDDVGTGMSDGEPAVHLLWVGGCYQPVGAPFYGCYPQLAATASDPEKGVTSRDSMTFSLPIPAEILDQDSSHPMEVAQSFLFFAACRGEIQLVANPPEATLPLECFDPSGVKRPAGQGFTAGYTTLYIAPVVLNTNPVVSGVSVDGRPSQSCSRDEDCTPLLCGQNGVCSPVIQGGSGRPKVFVVPEIDQGFIEEDLLASQENHERRWEHTWVDYQANTGQFDAEVQLVSDPVDYLNDKLGTFWQPDQDFRGTARIWTVVRDSRAGIAWAERDIEVR